MKSLESTLVELPLIQLLKEKGWVYIPGDNLERDSFREPLLISTLVRKIQSLNPDIELEDTEIWHIIRELQMRGNGPEDQKKILEFFKYGVSIRIEKIREVRYIRLFDFTSPLNNEFFVSNQVIHEGRGEQGDQRQRNDIILYINGIPLVNIECKSPATLTENWTNAFNQIKGYEQTIPELYKYVQIGVAGEQIFKYFPIVPWMKGVQVDEWRLEKEEYDPLNAIADMLDPKRLLDIIQNFLFIRREFGEEKKVLPRYIQYRAANKMVQRVLDNLAGKTEKNKGLIWHWQGTGKTLTMIFAANKLYLHPALQNPSIFFVVDRIDLEEQLYAEYNALSTVQPEIIGSSGKLKSVLLHDGGKGKRGIMITLINKFRPEELNELEKELKQTKASIVERKNVIVFIDEGHRSQYGLLAAQMKAIFKKAFFFALTGTPIQKTGNRNTYKEFGYPDDDDYYLDRYFIKESISEGYSVKIAYQPRLEKEDGISLNREMLRAFLEVELEEIPEKFRENVEDGVKKRLNIINLYLEGEDRIGKVAADIAQHFKENVDGKFKAMVVAASRKACVHYKRALDKHLPPEHSEIVMTHTDDDVDEIKTYTKELKKRYGLSDTEEINKLLRENFRDENDLPKILIVTSKLLTGYDAPILQTMYLDKPLKEHRLLQAIARTNRPYKEVKEAGMILDYVGVLKEIKKALENYSEKDLEGALYGMDAIKEEFGRLMAELIEIFKDVNVRAYDREILVKTLEILTTDEEVGEAFLKTYRHVRKIFELLGSDGITLDWFEDYKWLSTIYSCYIKRVLREQPNYTRDVQKYFEKTVKYVHKTTEVQEINNSMPVLELDSEYLKRLEERVATKKEKAANIVFALNRFRLTDKRRTPADETILDRVEGLITLWREKTKDYDKIYAEGAEIIKGMQTLEKRQKELGLSNLEYSFLLNVEQTWGSNEALVEEVRGLSTDLSGDMFPDWIAQTSAKKNIEQKIRKFV
ncbi:HsdR family type I site-specific deoxyribonuclease, partial [Methanocalculus sp.]|uniref:type I restriction endonuclease subunit R n=1 Tax=Methanocalculus sp. TaxID=2004547 RepID=UPI00260A3978